MDERHKSEVDWHPWAATADGVIARLETSRSGLSSDEAASRLATYGPNLISGERKRSVLVRLLSQFSDILILVLLAAAAVSVFLGEYLDAGVIVAVVLANGVIGFVQEGRAESALDAVRKMTVANAAVIRDGEQRLIDAVGIVPGDVVFLAAGDRVPADLRLVEARTLKIEEAALTGESVPVEKGTNAVATDAALGDRSSMAFSGTIVAAGRGAGVVVATAMHTEIGKIGTLLATVDTLTTPLVRQMERFGRQLTAAILAVAAIGLGFAVLVRSYSLSEAFMAMVGLVVAAIPEGLPAVMTVTLAIGVQRMARRNAVIRRMPAVETLGSVSVICTDKTGTLTRNEMTVRSVVTAIGSYSVEGVGYAPEGGVLDQQGRPVARDDQSLRLLTEAAILCNDARLVQAEDGWSVAGDPMEGALVALGRKYGLDEKVAREKSPRSDEVPFDASHRTMTTFHRAPGGGTIAYVKGAPEQILELCGDQLGVAGPESLDRKDWLRVFEKFAEQGKRVLAFAFRQDETGSPNNVIRPTFLGVAGMIDPPRSDAKDAVAECQAAGIDVKMITGDHVKTASAIGGQLGLTGFLDATTGTDLDRLDPESFRTTAREASVFARTSPEHKLRIVEALQADGDIAAMTGDGVNDAPALKRADIGIAMGRKGTEAAKDAAELVLLDDNFASIVAAIREGRTVYDNIKKVIAWTLPTSFGEGLVILAAVLAGLAMPVTPVQILWINMITVVALGLTLAFEPTEPGVMSRAPRRRDEPLLSGQLLWRMAFVSICFVIGAFGVFNWALMRGHDVETARTIVVNTIVVLEIFYLFSVRYIHSTSLTLTGVLGTRAVLTGVASVVVGQLAFTYLPFMHVLFDTRPLSLLDGAMIIGVGILLLVVIEIEKTARRRLKWA